VELPRKRSVWEVLAINALRVLGRLLLWLSRHPLLTLTAAAFLASVHYLGRVGTGYLLIGLTGIAAAWWWRWPTTFARFLGRPARGRWRQIVCYQRHWQPAMALSGLAREYGDAEYLPRIRKVRSNKYADAVLVDMLAGQAPADFEKVTDGMAHTFGARRCAVRVERPGRVWLDFFRSADALADTIRALPIPAVPDYAGLGLVLGRSEAGVAWVLRLLGTHVLIAGATGAGKGSVLWSIVRALANSIRQRSVLLWGVDPKGGMELTFGRAMFDRLGYEDPARMLDLLDAAVAFMKERQARLIGVARSHVPTIADPLLVLVVDELAALIAYTDRDTKRRAHAALQLLLSQGRAVGVVVMAAVQDPSKDIVPFRDLFPTRIGLRLVEEVQVDMVLGDGARKRGAECDKIPASMPGTGYVVLEGVREPVRVRAAYVSDVDLAEMCARYAPGMPDPAEQLRIAPPRRRSWLVRIFGRPVVASP